MGRAVIAAVFAVAITALTMLPGTDDDPAATGAPSEEASVAGDGVTASPPSPEPSDDPTTSAPATPDCTPDTALVDAEATPEARCLARRLDDWKAARQYGLGQQLNVSNAQYLAPVDQLAPMLPAVVGFDLDELAQGELYGFATPPLQALLELAEDGVVLTASWHTPNPGTGGDAYDRGWQDLGALLSPQGPDQQRAHDAFWSEVDAKIALLERLQTGDGGTHEPAAVVFRPFHEANGDWFWWAQGTDPAAYRELYAAVQQRAADAGVHNIVWGWSANARNDDRITDPLTILPERVDVVGVDSYEPMAGRGAQDTQLNLAGLGELAGRVPRAAVTEAGPHGSRDGAWDPGVVAPSAQAVGVDPLYVMMWFDDGDAADGYTGRKQLGSLTGTDDLLASCPSGICSLP
jgi:hypothetical protein